jgi:hypothetical protein
MAILSLPENTMVIGKIPGYNKNIDQNGNFSTELLKGVTFIDLRPMSYVFAKGLDDISANNILAHLKELFNKKGLFTRESDKMTEIFKGIIKRMSDDFSLSSNFANTEMIRLIAANDSTFTETFTNDYGETNLVADGFNKVKGKLGSTGKLLAKGLRSQSHSDMISILGDLSTKFKDVSNAATLDSLNEITVGAMAGMQMATPTIWSQSQYTSTLTVFVKLVAPTGTAKCIQKNIIEPVLMLLAASSPVTVGGTMYGFPPLWDIHAHGITNFRLGGIAALSLIRGSFETTFTSDLKPTVIDVRMTLVPLLNDFATQLDNLTDKDSSIYLDPEGLGVQNPGDIYRGMTNTKMLDPGDKVTINTIKL